MKKKINNLYQNIFAFCRLLKSILIDRLFRRKKYIFFEKEKLIYIPIEKCWTTSITKSLATLLPRNNSSHSAPKQEIKFHTKHRLWKKYLDGSYTIFTVVRNPLERIISCYYNQVEPRIKNPMQEVSEGGKYNILYYLFWYLKNGTEDLEKFLRKILKIPTYLMDNHFRPMVDFIWIDLEKIKIIDIEDLENWFEEIRKKYNLPRLTVQNKTSIDKQTSIHSLPKSIIEEFKAIYKKDYELYEKTKKL